MRQTMYHKARDIFKKSNFQKNGSCQTILERWYKDAKYRADLSEHGRTEEQIRQCDALALEDRSYEATPTKESTTGEKLAIFFKKKKENKVR